MSDSEEQEVVSELRVPRPRLTVTQQVSYQLPDDPPKAFRCGFDRELSSGSGEEVYERTRLKATQDWQEVDFGFLKGKPLAYVAIQNREGLFTQTNPTEEEKIEVAKKVLDIGIYRSDVGAIEFTGVPPTECYSGWPSGRLYIRCRSGEARYSLFAVPE
jgi:hypothetical protein